jgi:hypothetical protein
MVTGLNSEGQLTRKTLLSVPWYRVKSYEKHIKGHRFALVFQTGRDKVVMKRVVYTTDEVRHQLQVATCCHDLED